METVIKFGVIGFNHKINDQIEAKVVLSVFANTEAEALLKASQMVERKQFEVFDVQELINDTKK